MLLGDVIARLEDETVVAGTLVRLSDAALVAEMTTRAADAGLSLGRYAAWAVRHYADAAGDDEWTHLVGLLGRAEDPGAACLERAFTYVLSRVK